MQGKMLRSMGVLLAISVVVIAADANAADSITVGTNSSTINVTINGANAGCMLVGIEVTEVGTGVVAMGITGPQFQLNRLQGQMQYVCTKGKFYILKITYAKSGMMNTYTTGVIEAK